MVRDDLNSAHRQPLSSDEAMAWSTEALGEPAAFAEPARLEARADMLALEGGEAGPRRGRTARDLLEATQNAIEEARPRGERRFSDECVFDPLIVIEDALGQLRPGALTMGVSLRLEGPKVVLPRVVGDPARLRRILLKLIGGAAQSWRTRAVSVRVSAITHDHELALHIAVRAETGPLDAIAPVRAPRRERFVDAELSFAISPDLTRALDGALDPPADLGLDLTITVRLSLPTAKVEPAFSRPASSKSPLGEDALNGLRILVVEDVDLNRELFRMLLAPYGCVTDEAADGWAALEALEHHAYDVVLMDMNMPKMDGFEALRRIRAGGDERAKTPVLAVTGRALAVDIAKIRALGADGHLAKPFGSKEMVAAILGALQGRAAAAA